MESRFHRPLKGNVIWKWVCEVRGACNEKQKWLKPLCICKKWLEHSHISQLLLNSTSHANRTNLYLHMLSKRWKWYLQCSKTSVEDSNSHQVQNGLGNIQLKIHERFKMHDITPNPKCFLIPGIPKVKDRKQVNYQAPNTFNSNKHITTWRHQRDIANQHIKQNTTQDSNQNPKGKIHFYPTKLNLNFEF